MIDPTIARFAEVRSEINRLSKEYRKLRECLLLMHETGNYRDQLRLEFHREMLSPKLLAEYYPEVAQDWRIREDVLKLVILSKETS